MMINLMAMNINGKRIINGEIKRFIDLPGTI